MENEIVPLDPASLVPATKIEDVIKASVFLPCLRFYGASSEDCKSGTQPINTFCLELSGDKTQMGTSVECLPIAYRYTAIRYKDPVIVSHTIDSPEFKAIREAAESGDKTVSTGNIWGPEFLIWIPECNKFATMLFGSPSARIESIKMSNTIKANQPCMVKARKIETKKYTYYIQGVFELSSLNGEMPSQEEYAAVVDTFVNVKDTAPEVAVVDAETNERG